MKKIMWENWNEKEQEMADLQSFDNMIEDDLDASEDAIMQMGMMSSPSLLEIKPPMIYTPFGTVPTESMLKPSDRWQCWMGYTNFGITHKMSDKIKVIEGVEALRVMSRYTFCVGVGKMFNFTNVRKDIENAICKQ